MRRLLERLDDFVRFCLEWGSEELAKANKELARPQADSPLFILLVVVFGALVLLLAVWLSEVLGWNR